jgi:hypothetical protein
VCVCAADNHELDEAEVVQARIRGDVPAVHVHLPLLPRVRVCLLRRRKHIVNPFRIRTW